MSNMCDLPLGRLFRSTNRLLSPRVTRSPFSHSFFFFFNDTATTEIYTLSLHDALPISTARQGTAPSWGRIREPCSSPPRSEEHTSELQSRRDLVCRLLLEKKKKQI